jgi:O-antigen ligase
VTKEESVDSGKDTNYENYIEEILKKYFTDNSALYGNFGINSASIKNSIYKAVGRDSSGTTGRFEIWESAIMVFKEKPLFGWTHEGSLEPLNIEYENITGKSTTSITGGGVHNEYLTVLCSSGVLGFVCFIAVIAIVLIRFLEVLFDKKEVSTELLFSFSVVVYFLVSELVESRILYTVSFYNVVFWLYFGYLNYYCLKGKTNIAEKT